MVRGDGCIGAHCKVVFSQRNDLVIPRDGCEAMNQQKPGESINPSVCVMVHSKNTITYSPGTNASDAKKPSQVPNPIYVDHQHIPRGVGLSSDRLARASGLVLFHCAQKRVGMKKEAKARR